MLDETHAQLANYPKPELKIVNKEEDEKAQEKWEVNSKREASWKKLFKARAKK